MNKKVIEYVLMNYVIKYGAELKREVINELLSEFQRVNEENERLKKELWQLQHRKMWNKEATLQAELLIKENEELKNRQITKNGFICDCEQNVKYRKALEEIREMCSNTCEKNKDCIHSCYECKSIDEPVAINRILNKISEVLDERN